MARKTRIAVSLAAAALCLATGVGAQTQRSGGGESQKIMQQYQQLAAERTSLQAQVAQMKKDLDTSKTDLAAMKKERDDLKARSGNSSAAVAQANASRKAADDALEQWKQRTNELVAKFRETAQALKDAETDRGAVRRDLAARNAAFDVCAENNLELYEISHEVLDRYEHTGLFTRVSASEPFSQITRTRIENLVDDYRAHAQELRVKKRSP